MTATNKVSRNAPKVTQTPDVPVIQHPVTPAELLVSHLPLNYIVTSTLRFCTEGKALFTKPEKEGKTWLWSGLWHRTLPGSCHERLSFSAPLCSLPLKSSGFLARRPPFNALVRTFTPALTRLTFLSALTLPQQSIYSKLTDFPEPKRTHSHTCTWTVNEAVAGSQVSRPV